MSVKVSFRLEVRGYKGEQEELYIKEVTMPAAPTVGLEVSQEDIVLTVARVQYDIEENTYYVLIVEQATDESWDFLTDSKLGWSKK